MIGEPAAANSIWEGSYKEIDLPVEICLDAEC